jgi:hypothetical protein
MKMLSRVGAVILGVAALGLFVAGLSWRQSVRFETTHQSLPAKVQLSGAQARVYLEQSDDGKSLAQAITAARFSLVWEESARGESNAGGGYLGMSHEQNLHAWFAQDGVTVRPTLPDEKRDQGWTATLRLKSWGYGTQLTGVPPITSRTVNQNRIEYERRSLIPQSEFRNPKLVEWYENRAEGIEQGFTLNERPLRGQVAGPNEPLRVVLAVTGDLRARTKEEGKIELTNYQGKGALSYSKLVAVDANGKRMAARIETSTDGREITLVVEDADARYPVVIDPIVASLEKKFGDGYTPHAEARFGFDVAIDGDRAIVGAWRDASDTGRIYFFTRSGTTWSSFVVNLSIDPGGQCGFSVAISGAKAVVGCPGVNSAAGTAYVYNFDNISSRSELVPLGVTMKAGDRYGASVAIRGNNIIVGAPFLGTGDTGFAATFTVDSALSITPAGNLSSGNSNEQLGTSVAVDGNTFVLGAPGVATGRAYVVPVDRSAAAVILQPSDGASGDLFGQSVAISGNTAVIGAPLNSQKGSGAGAAYVFVRDPGGNWSQQQKLTGSDATAGNFFGASHIAIEGNTIVAGSYGYSYFDVNKGTIQNAGEAYVFMRNGTVWKEQAITVGDNHGGDEFGVGLGISGNSVIVGARLATTSGVARAGAAYVYRLDCVPPSATSVELFDLNDLLIPHTVCTGTSVRFRSAGTSGFGSPNTYQWRKNGLSIPGATTNSYALNGVSASDAGSYDVLVSNSCGGDISNAVILGVYSFSLNPTSQNFGVNGSNGIVNVASTGSCSWTAVSNSSFITVNSGSSGTGNGTVGFTVAANPNFAQRTGSITIAGITFNVSQDGTNCSYSISPTSQTLGANASTNIVNVTASAGCAWTATTNDPSILSINSGASGSGNGTVTYTAAANSTTSQRAGTLTIAGQTFMVTQAAGGPTELANVSTRLRIETGDNVLFAGFIVTGTQPKKIIVLGTGPSLTGGGVPGALADPTLELYQGNTLLDSNDNWVDSPKKQAIIDSMVAPTNDLESAIVATLPANNSQYTAIVRGAGNGTGVGTVQLFDLDRLVDSKLANISTRGFVQTGDNVLIAGTILLGQTSQKVIVRAIGPSLPFSGTLADPTLELRDQNGGLIDSNDNWKDSPNKQAIIDSTVPPTNDSESAIVATLPANSAQYTAIVRGVNNGTGIAVVEVFALN